ncbi:MAG: hypothetical protein ACRDY0_02190, partial [Acidimicrobiales bacterium]
FARTATNGWGSADVGGSWSGTGPAFAVTPGAATVAADASAPSTFLTSVSAQDVDAEVKISPPPISNGYVDVGMGVRYGQAGGTFYQVSAFYASGSNAGNYTAELKAEPADTAISPDVSTTIAGGTAIWFRLQAQGVNPTVLRWKIWQDGSPEPAGWTSTATDSTPAMQVAGGVGLKAYSGSLTQPVAFNGVVVNPVAVPPPTIESCPSGVVICDTFNRSVAGGWGSADSGGPWSTSGSIWSVQPGTGSLVASPAAPTNFLAGPVQDVDAEVKITPPGISGSYVDTGLAVRYNASSASAYQLSAYYATGNNNGDYTVELKTEPSNTAIEADVNTAVAGGTPFWLRLQATGTSPTTLSWKIWADGTTEPTAWTATATDGTPGLQAAGGVGVKGYVNANTTQVGFNVLWAADITPAATVLAGQPQISLNPLALRVLSVGATLTSDGAPVPGAAVVFSAGHTVLCNSVTDPKGVATCLLSVPDELAVILNLGYTQSFAGNAQYGASSSRTALGGSGAWALRQD